jgi:nucleoid DNA-binding protein
MNKTELTAALAQKLLLSKAEAAQRLDDTTAVITAELLKNNSISLDDFGTMDIVKQRERVDTHPVSGKKILLPPKLIVRFEAADALTDKLKEI